MAELLEFISSEILLYEKSGESEHDAENFATSMLALCIAVMLVYKAFQRFSSFPHRSHANPGGYSLQWAVRGCCSRCLS